jgi:hypothetical protein
MKIVDYANSRIFLALSVMGLAAGAQVALPREALAEASYPNRPVRIVLPLAAGGVGDTTARIIAEKLGGKLGQRFYVENQPGAGGGADGDFVSARRLHAGAADQRNRDQRLAVCQAALRSAEGFCGDFEPWIFRFHLLHGRSDRLQDAGGFHRGGQGETGRAQCRHHQYRQHAEPVCRIVQDRCQYRLHHRSLPRNARGRGVAAARQYCADDRQLLGDQGQPRRRQIPRAGVVRLSAFGQHARSCHRAGKRGRQLRCRLLERTVCARAHAAGNRQDAQPRAAGYTCRRRSEEAADRARHRRQRRARRRKSQAGSNPISTSGDK